MNRLDRRAIVVLVLLLLGGLGAAALVPAWSAARLPGNHQDYEPAQPIAFSHRQHAGELQIACLYCHSGAERSARAGLPAASTCMNCHKFVTATMGAVRAEDEMAQKEKRKPNRVVSSELQKLYDALALDGEMKPLAGKSPSPVVWTQVHSLPRFVAFDHCRHTLAGVECQTCHGPVETMERVRQTANLSMGWCVNCHRDSNAGGVSGRVVNASIDCAACHY